MERIRRDAAGAGTGDLEESARGQESVPKAVRGGKGRDHDPKNAEVALILAHEETAGTGPEAGRGGGQGREGIGREEGVEAGEGETEVEVETEKETGLKERCLFGIHWAFLNF